MERSMTGASPVSWRDAWECGRAAEPAPELELALAAVKAGFAGTEEATPEELEHFQLWHQADLLRYWTDEMARGARDVLKGWSWSERRKPCDVCGADCIAVDPSGRTQHPACNILSAAPAPSILGAAGFDVERFDVERDGLST